MFRFNRWAIAIAATILIALFALAGLLRPVADFARSVTLPLANYAAKLGQFFSQTRPADNSSEARIAELESRQITLAVDYAKLRSLEEENRVLRSQAKFLASSGYDSVGARVISRDLVRGRAYLLIDRGLNDRLEIGQAVVTNDGLFIGKIAALDDEVASVELLTDPNSRVAAAMPGQSGVLGVVEGRGNGAALLRYVPSTANLRRDLVIVTSGSEEKVPGQLPVGLINAVDEQATNPFINASIEPLVHFDQVYLVSVLRPSAKRTKL